MVTVSKGALQVGWIIWFSFRSVQIKKLNLLQWTAQNPELFNNLSIWWIFFIFSLLSCNYTGTRTRNKWIPFNVNLLCNFAFFSLFGGQNHPTFTEQFKYHSTLKKQFRKRWLCYCICSTWTLWPRLTLIWQKKLMSNIITYKIRAINLIGLLDNRAISLIGLLDIRALNLTGLLPFGKISFCPCQSGWRSACTH